MSEDIAERLNFCANLHSSVGNPGNADLFREARDEITRLRELVKAAYVEGALDFGGFCDRTHTVAEDRYSGSDVARWVDDVDAWESDNAG